MIYLECYPDKVLINSLGIPKNEIRHSHGKGDVCKKLEKIKSSKGIVDEDPFETQPTYISRLKLISEKNNIRLFHDENKDNYLIILCPSLEKWILEAAEKSSVNPSQHHLPNDAKELHRIINYHLDEFEKFVLTLKKQSISISTLMEFLTL